MLQALIEAYRMTSFGEIYAREYTAGMIKGRPAGDATWIQPLKKSMDILKEVYIYIYMCVCVRFYISVFKAE